jgi:hypothetical protein
MGLWKMVVATKGGGAVWRRGGVDSRPVKADALIPSEDGFAEDSVGKKVC